MFNFRQLDSLYTEVIFKDRDMEIDYGLLNNQELKDLYDEIKNDLDNMSRFLEKEECND